MSSKAGLGTRAAGASGGSIQDMETNNSLDDPARAFDDLRREVSLALRAVQGLAAEHHEQPDYRDTLKALDDQMVAANKALATIVGTLSLRWPPN